MLACEDGVMIVCAHMYDVALCGTTVKKLALSI